MTRTLSLLLGGATVVAAVDLGHKALAGPVFLHERSALFAAGIALATLFWAAAIVSLRSPAMALAAAPLVGGAAGNAASLAIWPGVPNPLVAGGLAFNVADLSIALGLVLLLVATVGFGISNRERLFEPI